MQDSLLAADQAFPGRIGYLQNHYERFQFPFTSPRLDLARQDVLHILQKFQRSHNVCCNLCMISLILFESHYRIPGEVGSVGELWFSLSADERLAYTKHLNILTIRMHN